MISFGGGYDITYKFSTGTVGTSSTRILEANVNRWGVTFPITNVNVLYWKNTDAAILGAGFAADIRAHRTELWVPTHGGIVKEVWNAIASVAATRWSVYEWFLPQEQQEKALRHFAGTEQIEALTAILVQQRRLWEQLAAIHGVLREIASGKQSGRL